MKMTHFVKLTLTPPQSKKGGGGVVKKSLKIVKFSNKTFLEALEIRDAFFRLTS